MADHDTLQTPAMPMNNISAIVLLGLLCGLLFTASVHAAPTVSADNGLSCAGVRYGSTLNCSAGEFAAVVNLTHASDPEASCTEGDYFTLNAAASLENSNATRYNIGFFIGENGNDPRETSGVCSVATFPTTPDPWFDDDGNVCGDFKARGVSTPTVNNLRVKCSANTSGQLEVPYVVSYQQNTGLSCSGTSDVTPGSRSKCNYGSATVSNVTVKPRPAAYYRFDETLWTGTSGEVSDNGDNNLDGNTSGGITTANTTPAISGNPGTCRYAVFDGSDDVITIPHNSLIQGSDKLTYAAWIYPTSWSGSTQQIMSKSVHDGGAGRAQMGLFVDGSNLKGRVMTTNGDSTTGHEVQTSLPSTNTWTHVALVFNGTGLVLYVNGSAVAVKSFASTTLLTNSDPLTIGNDYGKSYNFTGYIDEARIYTDALLQNQVSAIKSETHTCPAEPVGPDHIEIIHDGSGLTCSPETVTIKACSDASCSSLYTAQNVSVTLSPSGWVGGDTITFNGSTTAQLRKTTAGSVTLGTSGVSPTATSSSKCYIGTSENCALTFYDSGFDFDVPHHTAATTQTVTIKAVRKDDTTQQCVPGFQNVSKSVNFWSNYIDSATGTQSVSINGNTIAGASSGTAVSLSFDNNGESTFQLSYPDVGMMRLFALYEGSGDEAGLSMSGQDDFIAKPDHFTFSSITCNDGTSNPAATSASGAKFCPAGDNFTLTVEARNANGALTPNFGKESAAESVALSSTLVDPTGGNNPAVSGSVGTFGQDCDGNSATAGTACGTFNWPEVGIITLTPSIADGDYLGAGNVTGNTSGNVGRFYAHSFAVTLSAADFSPANGNFTYIGQDFTYAVAPNLSITAQSATGTTLQNYQGDYWKLGTTITAGSSVASCNTANQSCFVYSDNVGGSSSLTTTTNPITYSDFIDTTTFAGSQTLTAIQSSENFNYSKPVSPIAPFDADVQLQLYLEDSDGATGSDSLNRIGFSSSYESDTSAVAFNTTNDSLLRYGRATILDTIARGTGSGTTASLPLEMQYYDGIAFVSNSDDTTTTISHSSGTPALNCTDPDTTGDTLDCNDISITSGITVSNGGSFPLSLNSNINDEGGTLIFDLNNNVLPDYLRYDWSGDGSLNTNDTDPLSDRSSASVTFAPPSYYHGDKRFIYWQEQHR